MYSILRADLERDIKKIEEEEDKARADILAERLAL